MRTLMISTPKGLELLEKSSQVKERPQSLEEQLRDLSNDDLEQEIIIQIKSNPKAEEIIMNAAVGNPKIGVAVEQEEVPFPKFLAQNRWDSHFWTVIKDLYDVPSKTGSSKVQRDVMSDEELLELVLKQIKTNPKAEEIISKAVETNPQMKEAVFSAEMDATKFPKFIVDNRRDPAFESLIAELFGESSSTSGPPPPRQDGPTGAGGGLSDDELLAKINTLILSPQAEELISNAAYKLPKVKDAIFKFADDPSKFPPFLVENRNDAIFGDLIQKLLTLPGQAQPEAPSPASWPASSQAMPPKHVPDAGGGRSDEMLESDLILKIQKNPNETTKIINKAVSSNQNVANALLLLAKQGRENKTKLGKQFPRLMVSNRKNPDFAPLIKELLTLQMPGPASYVQYEKPKDEKDDKGKGTPIVIENKRPKEEKDNKGKGTPIVIDSPELAQLIQAMNKNSKAMEIIAKAARANPKIASGVRQCITGGGDEKTELYDLCKFLVKNQDDPDFKQLKLDILNSASSKTTTPSPSNAGPNPEMLEEVTEHLKSNPKSVDIITLAMNASPKIKEAVDYCASQMDPYCIGKYLVENRNDAEAADIIEKLRDFDPTVKKNETELVTPSPELMGTGAEQELNDILEKADKQG